MIEFISGILALIIAIICHEVAHGWVADKLGDHTARQAGRLTLNPIKHVDPLGSLFIPAMLIITNAPFLLGWAKPVPINAQYLRRPMRDLMLIALAGPATNFILALSASSLLRLLSRVNMNFGLSLVASFLISSIVINIILGVFNLIPIPPLDGSKVLMYFLPRNAQLALIKIEPYGILIVFVLLYFNIIPAILEKVAFPLIGILI